MSHLSDIERIQIIMERERDGKTLSTIATRHHCTHATVRNIAENELRENDIFFCPPKTPQNLQRLLCYFLVFISFIFSSESFVTFSNSGTLCSIFLIESR